VPSRGIVSGIGAAAVVGLGLACFGPVLLRGEQFGFRDAAHHYYPLYLRVQQEWAAGRLPLWDPWENGGQPLLGNPTAAVLYPGKLLYAALPYAWAARLYVVGHVGLAFAGMVVLLRGWGVGGVGSTLGGLAYAFGAPVLFQWSNVIYLIGAAWVPFGIRAADAWLRGRRRGGLAALAVVLASQTLGGDPQAAYLVVVSTLGYGLILHAGPGSRTRRLAVWVAAGLAAWAAVSVALAAILPAWRAAGERLPGWWPSGRLAWALALSAGLVGWLVRGRRTRPGRLAGLAGLAGAGALGLAIAGVQVVPIAEFASSSSRGASGEGLDRFGFSLVPYRLAELAWPNATGTSFPLNRAWITALPPAGGHAFWTPSLYLGGLALVLAVGGLGASGARPWRGWLTVLLVVALLGSFGRFTGPIGMTRWLPALAPPLASLEPPRAGTFAESDFRDGDGSVYGVLAAVLPGFDLFRYPSKLLTFVSLAVAALAGIGWDRAVEGRGRRATATALGLLAVGLVALGFAWVRQGALLSAWAARGVASPEAGPLDVIGAFHNLTRGLGQGAVVLALSAGLIRLAPSRPTLAGTLAVALLAADLAVANAPLVWTVPQSVFEAEPEALKVLEAAERSDPSPGPYRVHRAPAWHPFGMFQAGSPRRLAEMAAWERATLQPLHGLPLGVQYTLTLGVLEDAAYLRQFLPTRRPIGPALAGTTGLPPDREILYFPRRAFDLWNTRYVLLPAEPGDWRGESRAFAAFLDGMDLVAPDLERLRGAEGMAEWRKSQDWQIFRNRKAYPRAWIVHEARAVPPFERLDVDEKAARLRTLLYEPDPIWNEPGRPVLDLRQTALVEADDPHALRLRLGPPGPGEAVEVESYAPTRVVLRARLASRGLVVLADADAPGWRLEIDGEPAPILRANHRMRAAVVEAGTHRLAYVFAPLSLRVGGLVSLGGLLVLGGLVTWSRMGRSSKGG
jgi:hypothetical protein